MKKRSAIKVKKEEKKKKNGAHTHVRTTVQLNERIFTSVVVYSRTKKSNTKKNKSQLFAQLNCGLRVLEQLIFNIC